MISSTHISCISLVSTFLGYFPELLIRNGIHISTVIKEIWRSMGIINLQQTSRQAKSKNSEYRSGKSNIKEQRNGVNATQAYHFQATWYFQQSHRTG